MNMLTSTPRDFRLRTLSSVLVAKEQASRALLGKKWYRVSEIAIALNVHPGTVRAWITRGICPAVRSGGKGRYRIAEETLLELQGRKGGQ